MSKEKLRIDKTCLNCNHVVEQRYCPHCGQENIKTSPTFHHLFIHFFEDLTHYDNAFWRTIFYLFFKPAALTKAYVEGKRLSFLAPVRLYIFISFITFLLISLFPNHVNERTLIAADKKEQLIIPTIDSLHIEEKGMDGLTKVGILSQENNDTIKKIIVQTKDVVNAKTAEAEVTNFGYKSSSELNSIQKHGSTQTKVSGTEYWFLKKWLKVKDKNTNEEIISKFSESFSGSLPTVLFMYMPIFAFILWLFHDKKKWLYFDNGIFTLHYFSFLLLLILSLFFIEKLFIFLGNNTILDWIHFIVRTAGIFWMIYYFFPAHRRLYGERFTVSLFKSFVIITLNVVIVTILMVLFAFYTFINIH